MQAHLPFPVVLDLSPFTKPTMTLQNASQKKQLNPNMHFVPHVLKIMERTTVRERGCQKINIGSTSERREEKSHENQVLETGIILAAYKDLYS
jgi:hypothetical protein